MSKELIQHIEKIVSLTDKEFDFVLSHFTTKKFRKHQFLIQSGEYVTNDFGVVSGLVKASQTDNKGKQHIIQFAREDWWVTDYQAYFNQTKAVLDVECLEDTEVFCLTLQNRDKICAELHNAEHFFRKNPTQDILHCNAGFYQCSTVTQKNVTSSFYYNIRHLFNEFQKALIASYLGVSRETLSRLYSE